MRAAVRALTVLGLIALTSCGSLHGPAPASSTAKQAYVPWLPLKSTGVMPQPPPPTPSPPYPIPNGTPSCTAGGLHGELGHFSAATGSNLDMPVIFTNTGKGACVVQGFPDITVLDSRGGTLARAVGSEGRGTYFDDGPPVAILVRPGARAFVNFTWYDCRNPLAARLAVDLPADGGRLLIPFAVKGNYYMLCDSDHNFSALSRGPFSPVGIDWPPGPTLISVALTIDAPAKVKAGSTLVYYVTVGNQSPQDYVLTPCPDYVELLGPKVVALNYALNCASVARVAAGQSMTFQMEMSIPKTVQPGSYLIRWALSDGRIASMGTTTTVEVTS